MLNTKYKFYFLFRQWMRPTGFSLVEILIALTLLGIAGTFVATKIFEQLTEGQIQSTKIQMSNFKNILADYRRKCGLYPTTEQGLDALIQKPEGGRECKNYPDGGFMGDGAANIPADPWDEPYTYESNGKTFSIVSYGPDREPDTEDDIQYPEAKQ